jgi:vancomycin aglycone glucosyltransferase
MRVLLSTYGSRGDVEPLAGLAVALKALGAEAVVSAPGDQEFVDLLARAGVELAPAGLPTYAARMIGSQFDSIAAAAEGCDAIVATGLMPSAAAAQSVAELRGLAYAHVSFCPLFLPSHHHRPVPNPHHPPPPDVTDPRALWELNVQSTNALFGGAVNFQRALIGLPTVENVREHIFTRQPLLASDPALWPWEETDMCDAAQTGAWMLPDKRPLPADLEAFLDAGAPPVHVGFGSIAIPTTKIAAAAAIEAARAHGRRVVLARGWADNTLLDDRDDCFAIGEVNQQALFRRVAAVVHHGGAGTTTTAARAGAPQVIVPQIVDQPYWATRVAGLGAGVAHDGPSPTFESLSAALETALTSEAGARAAALAGRVRTDGASAAAKLLLERWGAR